MHSQNGRHRDERRFSNQHAGSRSEFASGGRDDRFTQGDQGRRGFSEERGQGRLGDDRGQGRLGDDRGQGRLADDRGQGRWGEDRGQGRWTNDRTEGGWQSADQGEDRGRDFSRGFDRNSDRYNDRYSQSGYGNSDFGPGVSDRWIQDRGRGYGNEERHGQSYGQNRDIDDRTQSSWREDRIPSYGGHGYGSEERHGQSYGQVGRDYGTERGVDRFDTGDVSSGRSSSRGVWKTNLEGGSFQQGSRGFGSDSFGGTYSGGFGGGFGGQGQREFSGRGPKGYVRSDERIREDVCERLSEGHLDASDIDVQVKDGEVTLSGQVSDRRTKRLVEELLDNIKGIRDVENKLKVRMIGARGDTSKPEGQKPEGQKLEGQKPEGQKLGDLQRPTDNGKSDVQKLGTGARA
jgi:osmotically-inducible protein OsmY